jgi:hypothetical protein
MLPQQAQTTLSVIMKRSQVKQCLAPLIWFLLPKPRSLHSLVHGMEIVDVNLPSENINNLIRYFA